VPRAKKSQHIVQPHELVSAPPGFLPAPRDRSPDTMGPRKPSAMPGWVKIWAGIASKMGGYILVGG